MGVHALDQQALVAQHRLGQYCVAGLNSRFDANEEGTL